MKNSWYTFVYVSSLFTVTEVIVPVYVMVLPLFLVLVISLDSDVSRMFSSVSRSKFFTSNYFVIMIFSLLSRKNSSPMLFTVGLFEIVGM